ncbi:unnamed protein product [Didymodactylos carnosus]|uniref:NAD(P)(+)--arginine ADP-ribosyltransferase n=1 Tax=Didymodactylos carnosus TaxID=1234261 RepID=A0A813S1P1_9BILA|nr:unnamed protein product [Didymodactylos carnosus]CAF1177882.1 unnamed protein product [Didymodactylos carnosus]CAF3574285.1 unnamed protein product [Didymodactylos carnosus]CAF3989179.1 unnamed protein product [Didymodactylos carnosus]
MLLPIDGYQSFPLLPLEKALEPVNHIFSDLQAKVWLAKENCKKPKNDLTIDQSAAIQIYTFEWYPANRSLYYILNQALRAADREKLVPWFGYIKLFVTALYKLPSVKQTVWRGVKADLSHLYPTDSKRTWWGLSSCTETIHVLEKEEFLGKTGTRTLFNVECFNGKVIRDHSYYQTENEILLLPASYFQVVSVFDGSNGLHIIHLRQIIPPYTLLQPPSADISNTVEIKQKIDELNKSLTDLLDPTKQTPKTEPVKVEEIKNQISAKQGTIYVFLKVKKPKFRKEVEMLMRRSVRSLRKNLTCTDK